MLGCVPEAENEKRVASSTCNGLFIGRYPLVTPDVSACRGHDTHTVSRTLGAYVTAAIIPNAMVAEDPTRIRLSNAVVAGDPSWTRLSSSWMAMIFTGSTPSLKSSKHTFTQGS